MILDIKTVAKQKIFFKQIKVDNTYFCITILFAMKKTNANLSPIPSDMIPLIHSLINSCAISVEHDDGVVVYKLCITGDRYMEMSRDFFTEDGKNINIQYNIFIYDENSDFEENIASMTVSTKRRIFAPSEQEIIDIFDACSKRVIQQEMQLLQNRIMSLSSEYTHN